LGDVSGRTGCGQLDVSTFEFLESLTMMVMVMVVVWYAGSMMVGLSW
jgi:hypothetical protein